MAIYVTIYVAIYVDIHSHIWPYMTIYVHIWPIGLASLGLVTPPRRPDYVGLVQAD